MSAEWQMVGTLPTGTSFRRTPSGVVWVVVDRWQDEITAQSAESQRRFRIQDTEYVYVQVANAIRQE